MEHNKISYSIVKIGDEWIAETVPLKTYDDGLVEYKNLTTRNVDYDVVKLEIIKLIDKAQGKEAFEWKQWR